MTNLKSLPFNIDLNQVDILLRLNEANNRIGELKGILNILPNPQIILSLINIGESKNSSAIENILSTYEDIFKEEASKNPLPTTSKEILNYKRAIELGFSDLKSKGFISVNSLVRIQEVLEPNKGGIRKLPGTVIMNDITKEIVHTPPQSEQEIRDYLRNLELYINENQENFDPLIKMALIHFQFESIHPFYDGNGRTGRILNVLYLVMRGKINTPVLYLSKYIIEHKSEYYQHLKNCNENIENIIEFVLYILDAVIDTSVATIDLILRIDSLISLTKEEMKIRLPEIYSVEIVEHLFAHIYTKNRFFRASFSISKNTATKYLKALVAHGFLIEEPLGKEVLYKNAQLFNIYE